MNTVVVGVSTRDSAPVVRWAAGEAAARGAGLRLVTATPAPDEHRAALLATLADGVPALPVTTDVVTGPPAAVLRDAAADADLLVVGADDASPFAEAISGSVPGDLLTTAPCPLAVVPRRERPTRPDGPVVVAYDDSPPARAALAYGFAAAARTGRRLTILRCGTEPPATGDVRPYQARYADVAVTTEVVPGDPRQVLVTASRRAALLVLGSRRRGRIASSVFGSVSRHLIRHGGCPVVVAHPQRVPAGDIALTS